MELEPIAPPTDEVTVARFERVVGAKLPDDYRSFVLTHNGGKPKLRYFTFADRTGPYTNGAVRAFAGLGKPQYYDLEELYETYCGGERVPPEVIPIAEDAFGNLVCLAVRGPHRGRVYFWDHERETEPAAYVNMDRLADSFTEFCGRLREPTVPR